MELSLDVKPDTKSTKKEENRLCIAWDVGEKGTICAFHRWVEESNVIPPAIFTGGHSGGEVKNTFALVENIYTGQVYYTSPDRIQFVENVDSAKEVLNRMYGKL